MFWLSIYIHLLFSIFFFKLDCLGEEITILHFVAGQCDPYGMESTDGATTAQLSGLLITSAFIVVASLSALR